MPVVIQDPRWEQSFPDVGGLSIPVLDPATATRGTLRLTAREARQRRAENEARLQDLMDLFLDLQLETILLSSNDHEEILGSFYDWADQRRFLAGREWRRTA